MRVPRRSTGAGHSVVARKAVTCLERRGWVIQPDSEVNHFMEEPVKKVKPFEISKRVVVEAWRQVKANQGVAGVDQESIADF